MSADFYTAIKNRHTIYGINKEPVASDERIHEIINQAVMYAPSVFNSQSARVILLLKEEHNKLWGITIDALRKIVLKDKFSPSEEKINSFHNGYGSILFFEELTTIENMQKNFPLFKDNFPVWSQQSSGMLQYIIWTSLYSEGFGVSLQHYNPLIDDDVKKEWNVPGSWKLISQMPFGKPTTPPGEKDFKPLEERVKVFK